MSVSKEHSEQWLHGSLPDFDIDLAHGKKGEKRVADLLNAPTDKVEVKNVRTGLDRLFVELAQNPRKCGEWKLSGLSISKADLWIYTEETTGSFVGFQAKQLQRAVWHKMAVEKQQPTEAGLNGDNPTRGFWLTPTDILRLN